MRTRKTLKKMLSTQHLTTRPKLREKPKSKESKSSKPLTFKLSFLFFRTITCRYKQLKTLLEVEFEKQTTRMKNSVKRKLTSTLMQFCLTTMRYATSMVLQIP